jgi:hypothetical protein
VAGGRRRGGPGPALDRSRESVAAPEIGAHEGRRVLRRPDQGAGEGPAVEPVDDLPGPRLGRPGKRDGERSRGVGAGRALPGPAPPAVGGPGEGPRFPPLARRRSGGEDRGPAVRAGQGGGREPRAGRHQRARGGAPVDLPHLDRQRCAGGQPDLDPALARLGLGHRVARSVHPDLQPLVAPPGEPDPAVGAGRPAPERRAPGIRRAEGHPGSLRSHAGPGHGTAGGIEDPDLDSGVGEEGRGEGGELLGLDQGGKVELHRHRPGRLDPHRPHARLGRGEGEAAERIARRRDRRLRGGLPGEGEPLAREVRAQGSEGDPRSGERSAVGIAHPAGDRDSGTRRGSGEAGGRQGQGAEEERQPAHRDLQGSAEAYQSA